jgi:hypothetical protein
MSMVYYNFFVTKVMGLSSASAYQYIPYWYWYKIGEQKKASQN